MGKQRPQKSQSAESDSMLRLKAPIHRVAANSITKNTPLKKELFKVPFPVAAVRLPPNLVGDFVKTYGSKYTTAFEVRLIVLEIYGRLVG